MRVTKGRAKVVARMQAPVKKSGVAAVRVSRKVRTKPGTYRVRATYVGTKDVARAKVPATKRARFRVR